ncbi:DNA phosphorothioation-dependent restriction protein DptH [Rhodopirellula baltica]|uniref:DNA sulfur modification system-associated protein 2 n=1 Tax=Rhodopirellula baltica WH47 TaxID=991778 RepID=F2AZG6_RHOBT|nr:DNA phosphorothioation-dependent restriction protein DptH [Rhodopirellula baltica]EGF24921.1 DNA sulfur modification system-associated protein 2 [Rhodopirellula baltica WH47]
MSETQFDSFLATRLTDWLSDRVVAGERYQFRSSDSQNTTQMIRQLHDLKSGVVDVKGTRIPFMNVAGMKLLCVAHSDNRDINDGFNENYISMLRDRVAEQSEPFDQTSLLIIHNSLLDTLVNSAIDLADNGSPWSPEAVQDALVELANTAGKSGKVYKQLLQWQSDIISEEGGSVFGFRQIHDSIATAEELDLRLLGLFNDGGLADMDKPQQIKKRLEDNRRLHEEFDRVTHHFPDEIAERLRISESFEKKHFSDTSDVKWQDLDLQVIKNELIDQEGSKLEFLGVESEFCTIVGPRNRSETTAGKRRKSLVVVAKPEAESVDLTIEFIGDDLIASQVRIEHNKNVADASNLEIRKSRNRRRVAWSMPVPDSPEMFRIRLDRSQTVERFEFSVLVVKQGHFHVSGFENAFLINTHESPDKRFVLLQTDERELSINPEVSARWELTENDQSILRSEYGAVVYEMLYEDSDLVSFEVESNGGSLRFNVEGEMSQQSLTLPLLMDEGRFNRLFDDNYNGKFLPKTQRVVIDNKETNVVAARFKMLDVEQQFVDDKLLCYGDDGSSKPTAKIREAAPALFDAWSKLNEYFRDRETLPSLASWGTDMIDLAGTYVGEYQAFLKAIELGKSLDDSVRDVMKLGCATFDGRRFLTPFHPLILSYYRYLAVEITRDADNRSFKNVPGVTRRRLNARGLLPYVYSADHEYCYTQTVEENAYWLEIVPQEDSRYEYVNRLTKEKIEEFVKTFDELFKDGTDAPLLINSVNNGGNREVFIGILDYFRSSGKESEKIHVNLYDDELSETEFDRFAELGTYSKIRKQYGLDKGKAKENADSIIDLLRSRLTFSKFRVADRNDQAYAHLTLFRNNQKVQRVSIDVNNHISGVACDGLLNGEASCSENQNYYTGFGLQGVETAELPHLELARLVGTLQQPLIATNETYNNSSAIRLAVSDAFRDLLDQSYASSLWVTIIDPKVTLKFFEKTKDVVLIHFSDQYTNSAGYDAITVTKQSDLYREVLKHGSDEAVGEFNAFNGEWLLKMVTAKETIRREREGIIGAWKLMCALVSKSDITWVPMSVAEMIRVSGNIGLRMSDSDFSRYHKDKTNKGRISDDVLFVGFNGDSLYLLPIEVKTGSSGGTKAHEQAKNLREYLVERLFAPATLEGKIYRSLLVRQVLMQIEKYELYEVFPDEYFAEIHGNREKWLRGDFHLCDVEDYPSAFVIEHLDSETCFETSGQETDGVATLKLPVSYLDSLLKTPRAKLEERIHAENFPNIPARYFLGRDTGQPDVAEPVPTADPPHSTPDENAPAVALNGNESETDPPEAMATNPRTPETLHVEFGTDVKTKKQVFWEPTNTGKVLNPNTAIIGTMGTGKTQFTKSLVTQLIRNQAANVDRQPIGVLILDYKADYVKDDFVEATGAKVLDLHKLPFNPFALFGNKPMLPMHTASQFRATITKAFGLGNKQQNRINSLVMDAYEAAGIFKADPSSWSKPAPTIQDVWAVYNAQEKVEEDSLYAALAELINFEIFEPDRTKAKSLYDMIDGVTVINLSGYDQVIQNLVVALTLDLFYAQMHQKGSSKIDDPHRQLTKFVLVDEADNFMKQEFPGLRKLLKEGREFGVGTILSTQELTHFKTANNDYSGYILSWIIHRVASIKSRDIKSLFNTAGKDEVDTLTNSIHELEKHQSLYIDGEKHITKIRDLAFWQLAIGQGQSNENQ